MNITVEDIKNRLRQRLIEHDGNIAPHDLLDIVEDARDIGLTEHDIARLVPEVDISVNWPAIREERRAAAELKLMEQQRLLQNRELIKALIDFSFRDGMVEQAELVAIFDRVAEVALDEQEIALEIKSRIDTYNYKPYPNFDPKAASVRDMLVSTSWYEPRKYASAKRKAAAAKAVEKPAVPASEPAAPPVIHFFKADKYEIRQGEKIYLHWDVSGVDIITISGMKPIAAAWKKVLIAPGKTTDYVLRAGDQAKKLTINVKKNGYSFIEWLGIIFGILFLISLLGKCMS